jgi:hypothetical protein
MLLAGANGDDEARIRLDERRDLLGPQLLDATCGGRDGAEGGVGHLRETLRRSLPAAGPRALVAPAAAAAALLLASGWLAEPGIEYVAGCLIATAIAIFATFRWTPPSLRVPLAVSLAALAALLVAAGRAELRLGAYSRAPAQVGATRATAQQELLRRAVDDELIHLRRAVHRGLEIPGSSADPAVIVSRLERTLSDLEHRALLLVRGPALYSWAGTLHANPGALASQSGIVATPFGLTLYAAFDSAGTRAIATSLLYAAPPSDRLSRGLAQRLPSDEVTEGFSFAPGTDSLPAGALRYVDGGRPLFIARALVPSAG